MADYLAGIPSPSINQVDALGARSGPELGREIVRFHRDGLRSMRERMLTWEKYAVHLIAEGDGQWADIFDGGRIAIPTAFAGQMLVTENLLRPIVDNAVAYHTRFPFYFTVDSRPDPDSRQRAIVDKSVINYLARTQRWNAVFAQAMYLAMAAGSCPVHAFWRDDLTVDPYEPVDYGQAQEQGQQQLRAPQKGIIDAFVGDPFDSVVNPGARRGSCHRKTWGRTVPLSILQKSFPEAANLSGSTRLPSASRWQRIVKLWNLQGLERHGTAAMRAHRPDSGEELIAVLCEELPPGVDAQYPQGRITLVAVQGSATLDTGVDPVDGQAVVLHSGPLPAGRFSDVRVYSSSLFDDYYGKPFMGDLDDLQVQLNQALSARGEYIRRSIHPPLIDTGIINDTAVWTDDARLEVDPSIMAMPQFLNLKVDTGTLERHILDLRAAMYTIGGYQAASRGESEPGDAASKVKFLAEADDTIHGPTNQRYQETVEEFAALNLALFREYGDVPWLVEIAGRDYEHMIEDWIDRSMVSQRDPIIRLVSGFGATIASKITELSTLVTMKTADAEPAMTTDEFREKYPDQSTFAEAQNPRELRQRRAKVINGKIRMFAKQMEQQLGPQAMNPLFIANMDGKFNAAFPPLPDDDPMIHFETLQAITQDEFESPLARKLAEYRQGRYQMALIQYGLMPPPIFAPIASPENDLRRAMGLPEPPPTQGPTQAQPTQAQAPAAPTAPPPPQASAPTSEPRRPGTVNAGEIRPPGEPANLRG